MARFDISQYTTVAERIDLFWKAHPSGRLHTELVHFSPERVVIKAEVYLDRDDPRPVTVDFAEERPETSPVNKVSMVENCATSSLGRALADLGGQFTGSSVMRSRLRSVTGLPKLKSSPTRTRLGYSGRRRHKLALPQKP